MDIQQEVADIKKELVDLIITHLRENRLSAEEAQQLATDFLAALPIENHQQLLEKLKSLGEKYDEANEIYVEELGEQTATREQMALNQMRDHIKQGNMDAAIQAAKSLQGGATV